MKMEAGELNVWNNHSPKGDSPPHPSFVFYFFVIPKCIHPTQIFSFVSLPLFAGVAPALMPASRA